MNRRNNGRWPWCWWSVMVIALLASMVLPYLALA